MDSSSCIFIRHNHIPRSYLFSDFDTVAKLSSADEVGNNFCDAVPKIDVKQILQTSLRKNPAGTGHYMTSQDKPCTSFAL